jgi:predicted RNA-binding Zn-ribbon protein involved in translation (DUF1610 family)
MTAASSPRHVPRNCPQCGSARIHRSHRKGLLDHILSWCGAEICRCHDCRVRRVWIWSHPFRLASADTREDRWTAIAVLASGFLACMVLVWWAITRFGELAG